MPNLLQSVYVLSSLASFSACYFLVHTLFPGVLPRFSLDLLLNRKPVPPPAEKIQMSLSGLFDISSWEDLLAPERLIPLVIGGLTAVVLGLWFTGKKGASLMSENASSSTNFAHTRVERQPVLDPKEYKEFPLVEKVVISPNTAL